MTILGGLIADLIDAEAAGQADAAVPTAAPAVAELCAAFPIY
jgi:glycine hydroxymethyltransferase